MLTFRRKNRPLSQLNSEDVKCCIDLILKNEALHVDCKEHAKMIVEEAEKQQLDFLYEHTPYDPMYQHTVRNLTLSKEDILSEQN